MTQNGTPGWLSDPADRAEYRWFDGTGFTDQVATDGIVSTDPLGAPLPPAPSPPPGVPPQPDGLTPVSAGTTQPSQWSRLVIPGLVATLGVLALGIGVAMLLDGGGGGELTVEALLEPADTLGPEPFTLEFASKPVVPIPEELATPLPGSSSPTTADSSPISQTTGSSASPSPSSSVTSAVASEDTTGEGVLVGSEIVRLSAAAPGLYGGTQDNASCSPVQLIQFLVDHPDKASAWVDALNNDVAVHFRGDPLTVEDIGPYVGSLTPAVLLADTLVVNNGFWDGSPTPRDAVLQKGSAVLVDEYGIPRTRCACGNPLTQPSATTTQVEAKGDPWPGFNTTKIVSIQSLPGTMTTLSLIDLQSGIVFNRPVGTKGERDISTAPTTTTAPTTLPSTSAPETTPESTTTIILGTGDVQATLRWQTDTDLDLHVQDPAGQTISWDAPTSESGGTIDVDQVPVAGDNSAHVENIFWPEGESPGGTYTVWVQHFEGSPSAYTLEVRVAGETIHSESGQLGEDAHSVPFVFER